MRTSKPHWVEKIIQNCGNSNTLDGSQDDAIYDNKMPKVADDDLRLTAKRTTMAKNLNCVKFSQTKRLLQEAAKVTVMSEICVC